MSEGYSLMLMLLVFNILWISYVALTYKKRRKMRNEDPQCFNEVINKSIWLWISGKLLENSDEANEIKKAKETHVKIRPITDEGGNIVVPTRRQLKKQQKEDRAKMIADIREKYRKRRELMTPQQYALYAKDVSRMVHEGGMKHSKDGGRFVRDAGKMRREGLQTEWQKKRERKKRAKEFNEN
jgi:hypothetical protein